MISHAKIQRIQVYSKPEPYRLGTMFPIKVTFTNNDGTFNGTFDFDRMNAVKHILVTKYI